MTHMIFIHMKLLYTIQRTEGMLRPIAPPGGGFMPYERETAGKKLERYLARAEMQQKDLAVKLGVEASYISRMVNDRIGWVNGRYFGQIASILRLKDDEIRELNPAAVVNIIPNAPTDPDQSARDLVKMGAEPIIGEYLVPILGDVAAGGRMDTFIPVENAEEWIDAGRGLAMRYGLSNLYALRVTGDSMYSENVRFSVPDGGVVIVHRELAPVRGDIVVAYIEELDVGVVKSYGEPEDVTLSSYNPTGPIYRANQYRIRMCGVVVETRNTPLTRRNGYH